MNFKAKVIKKVDLKIVFLNIDYHKY